jgi:hypothetical protein
MAGALPQENWELQEKQCSRQLSVPECPIVLAACPVAIYATANARCHEGSSARP